MNARPVDTVQFNWTREGCLVQSVETDAGEEITLQCLAEAESLELLEPTTPKSAERHWTFG